MMLSAEAEKAARLPRLFTYMRYNADVSREGLTAMGLGVLQPEDLQRMDSTQYMDALRRVGEATGRQVAADHFAGFV